jgi:hypothetical protein
VPGAVFDQRQDQQLRAPLLQLTGRQPRFHM